MKNVAATAISLILILAISVCAMAWPIPDSGHTKCYDDKKEIPCPNPGEDFYGQDGNYTINPRSYTKLDAQGKDLPDSAGEWVMVRDNVTGLIWEVKQAKDDIKDYSNPHDADNDYTWYDSNPETNGGDAGTPGDGTDTEDFINALNSERFGGNSDWRLPTIKELASLANLGRYGSVINSDYFHNTSMSSDYWSATTYASYTSSAWCVHFYLGNGHPNLKSGSRYVRVVRSGQSGSFDPLVINGDGTVTDTGTGLTWQQQGPDSEMNWKGALAYCETLSLGGYTDWRLPSREELRSIVDYGKYDPAMDTEYFPDIRSSSYWSATTNAGSTSYAWYVYFSLGYGPSSTKSGSRYVRGVRSGQAGSLDHLVIASIASPSSSLTIYEGESVNFQGSVEDGDAPFGFSWNFDGGAANSNKEDPGNVIFRNAGVYIVTFTVSDDDNDTDSDSVTITVKESPNEPDTRLKAIIVAGGGPYPGNAIWKGTRRSATYAYNALVYQGYDKENIYYLTSDTALDLDKDGVSDVHEASNSNFEHALTTWARGAENLFIYMVDHGGEGTFRMNPNEVLWATELNSWLDTVQPSISEKIILVYDACRSGSFLPLLAGADRILMTSSSDNEDALFASDGTLSFGYMFWSNVFKGDSFYQSYVYAKENIRMVYHQTSQIEANGNGFGNEMDDQNEARELDIFKETAGDIPFIGKVSPEKTLENGTSALIYASELISLDEVDRVWAVITPPGYSGGSLDEPVTDIPLIDLNPVGNNRYQATYSDFDTPGTYNISVFASNSDGILSLPKQTTVTVPFPGEETDGYHVTPELWIKAIIHTEDKGPVHAVWKRGSEAVTSRGDRVIWGHFYASPRDVKWGNENNPDLFVKIWFDAYGRTDVNYFHVSVPEIEVFSDYPYDGDPDVSGTTTMARRYIRQYYENGRGDSEENHEDGYPPPGYFQTGNPSGHTTDMGDVRFGSLIDTVEKGLVEAKWRLGGQGTTAGGHQVVWGHFYADPSDVSWGSPENPDLFVKIWFDASGRIDVNFFHVSVPDIEVYSDFPNSGGYDQKGTTILNNRYVRQEYRR